MKENAGWWVELFVEVAIFVIGFAGNVLVLIIVQNTRKITHGIFVTSLAVADLVLLRFDSPVSF